MSATLPATLIVDNVRSLYNVGSLFRLADGVKLEAIYLCGITGYPQTSNDPRPAWVAERADKEIRKTGLSGVDSIPFRHFATTLEAIAEARSTGHQIVALELTESSQDYRQATYHFPLALIVGHETEGVDPAVLTHCDQTVHLPMRGAGQSLNVATAAAAILYHLVDRFETTSSPVDN